MTARCFISVTVSLLLGCSTTVIPPATPADPVTVFLVDHGRHSSLVMPRSEREITEYAYGEWKWFALGDKNALSAMLWPTGATLGRRSFDIEGPADADTVAAFIASESVSPIIVDDGALRRLLDALDERFARREADAHFSEHFGLMFVPDDTSFHLLNNCNAETAHWLEALGCEVRGSRVVADFRIRESVK